MGLSKETIETWECDSCGAHTKKAQEDFLGRDWPPAGWVFVGVTHTGLLEPPAPKQVACSEDCYRHLLTRDVDLHIERVYRRKVEVS